MKTIKKLKNVLIGVVFMINFLPTGLVSAANYDHYPNDPYLVIYLAVCQSRD